MSILLQGYWACRLSVADLWVAGLRSLLEVSGIGIILGLMTVIWGLKVGIVSGFASEQLRSPEATRIFLSGFNAVRREEIDWLRAQPETGFAQPNSSFINSRIDVQAGIDRKVSALMIPTGANDPHLPDGVGVPAQNEVVLGDDTAIGLGVEPGDRINITLPSIGEREALAIELNVVGVTPTSTWFERAVLLDPFLVAAIDQRGFEPKIVFDGSVPNFGILPGDSYPSLRVYAESLDSVAPLVRKLSVLGWNAQSRERLIAERNALENAVGIVFSLVIGVAAVALSLSVIMGLVNRSLRLTQPLVEMRANGMARTATYAVPVIQAVILTMGGWLIAALASYVGMRLLNDGLPIWLAEFGISGQPVSITPTICLAMGLFSLGLSLLASLFPIAAIGRHQILTGF